MDKAKLIEEFSQLLNEIEKLEQKASGFHEFEKESVLLLNKMSCEVIEETIGKAPKDYRKKRCKTYYAELEFNNGHKFVKELKGIKMSPLLQEITAFVGQNECYESSSELIEKVLNIKISDSTVHKVCTIYGQQSEQWLSEERQEYKQTECIKQKEVVYAHCDGGMLLTRTDKWKEVKVGRVYKSSDLLKEQHNRGFIRDSWYVFHIGDHKIFKKRCLNI